MARNSIKAFSLSGDIKLYFSSDSLEKANRQIKASTARMQASIKQTQAVFSGLAGASAVAFGSAAAGFGMLAMSAAKFEESFVNVKKTLNISDEVADVNKAFKSIQDSLLNISKLTPVTTDELNQIAAVGGQLGIAAKDIVAFTTVIQKLTVATNLGAEDAALSMARLSEITGLTSSDLDNLGASLVSLGNNFAATESEIVNASLQIATATAQISGELNNAAVDALAFSTALRAIGQPAQAGATAVVRLMTEINQAVELGGEKLEIFAATAGMSMGDFRNLFAVDSTQAIAMFVKGLDKANVAGMNNVQILQELGLNQVRTRKAILALSKANDTLFDAIDNANTAYVENAALNEEAERRYDTLFSKIQQLKNLVSAGVIDLANDSNSLEASKGLIEGITNLTETFLNNLKDGSRILYQYIIPLLTVARVMKTLQSNTLLMADSLGAFGVAEEAARGIRQAMAATNSSIPLGPSIEKGDFQQMGMRAFKGGRIDRGDRIAANMRFVPGASFLGNLFGMNLGKSRQMENIARQSYFQARPSVDAMMQNMPVSALGVGAPLEEFTDEMLATLDSINILGETINLGSFDRGKHILENFNVLTNTAADTLNDINAANFVSAADTPQLTDAFGTYGEMAAAAKTDADIKKALGDAVVIQGPMPTEEGLIEAEIAFKRALMEEKYERMAFQSVEAATSAVESLYITINKQLMGFAEALSGKIAMFKASRRAKAGPGKIASLVDKMLGMGRLTTFEGETNPFFMPDSFQADYFMPEYFKENPEVIKQINTDIAKYADMHKYGGDSMLREMGRMHRQRSENMLTALSVDDALTLFPDKDYAPSEKNMQRNFNKIKKNRRKSVKAFDRYARLVNTIVAFEEYMRLSPMDRGNFAKFAKNFKAKDYQLKQADLRGPMARIMDNAFPLRQQPGKSTVFDIADPKKRAEALMGGGNQLQFRGYPLQMPYFGELKDYSLAPIQRILDGFKKQSDGTRRITRALNAELSLLYSKTLGPFMTALRTKFLHPLQYQIQRLAIGPLTRQFSKLGDAITQFITRMAPGIKVVGRGFSTLGFPPGPGFQMPKGAKVTATNFGALATDRGVKLANIIARGFSAIFEPVRGAFPEGANIVRRGPGVFGPSLTAQSGVKGARVVGMSEQARAAKYGAAATLVAPSPLEVQINKTKEIIKGMVTRLKISRLINLETKKRIALLGKEQLKFAATLPKTIGAALSKYNFKAQAEGIDPIDMITGGKKPEFRTDKKVIDELLDSVYGKSPNKLARFFRRNVALKNGMKEVNEIILEADKLLESNSKFLTNYTTKGGKTIEINKGLSKSFKAAQASVGKFTALGAGFLKFSAAIGILYATFGVLFKFLAKLGARSRGMKQFTESMRVASEGIQEYTVSINKLAEAEKMLAKERGVIGATDDTPIIESLDKYIENQRLALAKQRQQMAQDLGTSFIKDMAMNRVNEAGAYSEQIIKTLADGLGRTEDVVIQDLGSVVGEAIYGMLDTGELPTFGSLFNDLFFTDSDTPEFSKFFSGTTRDFLEAAGASDFDKGFEVLFDMYEDAYTETVKRAQAIQQEAMEGLENTSFGRAYYQGANDITNVLADGTGVGETYGLMLEGLNKNVLGFINNYKKVEGIGDAELFGRIGRGDFGNFRSQSEEAQALFLNVIQEEMRKVMPDATDAGIGKATVELLTFFSVYESMTGKTAAQIADNFDMIASIGQDSALFQPLTELLRSRLDELEIAGYVTADAINDAFGDVSDPEKSGEQLAAGLSLYKDTMFDINKELIDGQKDLQDEFGITAEMSMKLAIKAKEAFKQMRDAMVDLGKPLQEDSFADMTFGQILSRIEENRRAQEEFERNISQLRVRGDEFLANQLLEQGIAARGLASRYVEDPAVARATEYALRTASPSTAGELGISSPLQDNQFMDDMRQIGLDVAEGLMQGIKDGYDEVTALFGNLGEDILEALRRSLEEESPSKAAMRSGQNFLKGLELGITGAERANLISKAFEMGEEFNAAFVRGSQNVDYSPGPGARGSYGPPTGPKADPATPYTFGGQSIMALGNLIDMDNLKGIFEKFGGNAQAIVSSIATTAGSLKAGLEGVVDRINQGTTKFITRAQEAWSLVTNLTQAERAYNQSILSVLTAKQSLARTLRTEASLNDRIADTKEKLDKLEIEGRKNNVTVKERVGILQQLLSLREMEKRAAGEYDPRTALNIQKKEEEVETLARMYDAGVVSALEFEAAQQELSEMKGEFKTEEDKELFFLQLADTQAEYEKSKKDALKVDQDLISTREEYFGLLDERERKTQEVTVATDSYRGALENVVTTNLAFSAAIVDYNTKAPAYVETLLGIKDTYGEVNDEVSLLYENIMKVHNATGTIDGSVIAPEGTAKYVAPAQEKATEDEATSQAAKSLQNLIDSPDSVTAQSAGGLLSELLSKGGLSTAFDNALGGQFAISDAELQKQLLLAGGGMTEYSYYNPSTQSFTTSLGPDGKTADRDLFYEKQDANSAEVLMRRFANAMPYERQIEDILFNFFESIGLNLVENAQGVFQYAEENVKVLEARFPDLAKALAITDEAGFTQAVSSGLLLSRKAKSDAPSSSEPITEIFEETDNSGTKDNPVGNYIPGQKVNESTYYETSYGVLSGRQIMSSRRQGIPGLKMGGRIPDMSHMMPKKYAMGGRDNMMRRALVGEYGPEEVRFVPGSGFLVKPLTTGGRGNNTIVQNLSVNVTGIPVDNASARKAALQIKKALQRLDREGRAGGGVRNT